MNRKALISINKIPAAKFLEAENGYQIKYLPDYSGPPVSLALPIKKEEYVFSHFPPFFDGLLPEGIMLEVLLKKFKIDADDYFGQLLILGNDLVGAVTVREIKT